MLLAHSLKERRYFLAAIALFIIPISGISIDIYVPSLPALSQYYHVSNALVQMSITFYMLGLGVMQCFAGSISDSFGRRKPSIYALLVYILTVFLIPYSSNIYTLLSLRLLQGMMVAVISVPMRSVIPDLFSGREFYRMTSFMTLVWSIGPMIAPVIGGYLQQYYGWQANFHFLLGYGMVAFGLVTFFLPETSSHRHAFQPQAIWVRSKTIIMNWQYLNGVLINSLLYSLIIVFSVTAPFLVQNVLHYSAVQFGHMALFIGLAWFLGSFTNTLTMGIDPIIKNKFCLWIMLMLSLVLLAIATFSTFNIYVILIPTILIIWLGGTIFPINFAKAMALYPTMTGSANALFGSMVFSLSGLVSILASSLKSNELYPFALSYLALIVLCLLTIYGDRIFLRKKNRVMTSCIGESV